ncbi:rhomboid family intramembrane serine protease [Corynebacterium uterequi]|uniref:Putative membrane protein n=1 Tax=Corynebacterium uterequi TaxID=1072256 RepID=A0A0G3H9M0_9CORY|nr:rhomboid family intramembrane serine protease [Corynebacterium uterequi]AKK10066.1 putative membrane protein [Corynebacterium uterequi]
MKTWLTAWRRRCPVSATMVVVCTVIYALAAVQTRSFDELWSGQLAESLVLWAPLVHDTQWGWLRPLTMAFFHLDLTHLVVNMVVLILVGSVVEPALGSARYGLVSLSGTLGASAAVMAQAPMTPTAGASGTLFSLMVVAIAVARRRRNGTAALLALLGVNLGYTFLDPGVSVSGHLGGLLAGAIMAWPATSSNRAARWGGTTVPALIAAAAIAAL